MKSVLGAKDWLQQNKLIKWLKDEGATDPKDGR
jgi:hypothetical protein